MESQLLSEREKVAVLWAEHVTKNTARSRDDIFARAREVFADDELVELTLMSGLFNLFNRFMDSLRVPLEPQEEIDKIKRSINLDPERVRNYMQSVLDTWPTEFAKPADSSESK